jgi:hypothetical protein
MDQSQIAEVVERYLKGEMDAQEKLAFEEARKNNAELDQSVVEYHFFFEEMMRGFVAKPRGLVVDHVLGLTIVKGVIVHCNQ